MQWKMIMLIVLDHHIEPQYFFVKSMATICFPVYSKGGHNYLFLITAI